VINLYALFIAYLNEIIQIGWTELANINFKLHSLSHKLLNYYESVSRHVPRA